MLEQAMLREQFETILADQQAALGMYESAALQEKDPNARAELDLLCREKKRHILLTERLLEIVD